MKRQLIFAIALLAVLSCTADRFDDGAGKMQTVRLQVQLPEVKLDLASDHSAFNWESGDAVTIFNDKDQSTVKVEPLTAPCEVSLPSGTKTVYGVFPHSSSYGSGPSSVSVTVPAVQTQSKGGSLSGLVYPMASKSSVSAGQATLTFAPMASALALNIYKSEDYLAGEKIERISVKPLAATGYIGTATVNLAESLSYTGGDSSDTLVLVPSSPVGVADGKPADVKGYAGQLYVLMGRQKYKGLQFDIKTSEKTYRLKSSSDFTFNCTGYDFILTSIDLSKGLVVVDYSASIESVTDWSTTESATGSLDNAIIRNVGTLTEDVIPDFSTVGYHHGDAEPPYLAVKKTITVNEVWRNTVAGGGTYADSTAYIQAMIDSVGEAGGGALLFKDGTYHVSRTLFIDHDNLVVRGESRKGTIFYGDGLYGWSLFFIGKSLPASSATAATDTVWNGRVLSLKSLKAAGEGKEFGQYYVQSYTPKVNSPSYSGGTAVIEEYVPVGRMYVEVENASDFSPGDEVGILRPHNNDWLSDIGMDKIASNGPKRTEVYNAGVQQWTNSNFRRFFRRTITAVSGNRVYFDAPLPQSLDASYGGGKLYHETYSTVRESGVENLTVDSWFDKTKTQNLSIYSTGDRVQSYMDEKHTWKAIEIKAATDCWVRDVDSYHMGYSLVCITTGAKRVTVSGCNSYEPASYLHGGRRYAFCLEGFACMCLFKNCTVDMERHGFISNVDCGPNVYYNCTGTRMCDGPEPHQHWCLAALYDNMKCLDTHLYLRDRGNSGTGHGWAGANYVFWNCRAYSFECSMVWSRKNTPQIETMAGGYKFHSDHPSGYNWCIGSIGLKKRGTYTYTKPYFSTDPAQTDYYLTTLGIQYRPDAYWYPERAVGTQGSESDRVNLNNIPSDLASKSWWPGFSGKVASFSNPESLYLSQLEDRHAKGIYYK